MPDEMSVVEDLDLRETIVEGLRKSLKPFGTLGKNVEEAQIGTEYDAFAVGSAEVPGGEDGMA